MSVPKPVAMNARLDRLCGTLTYAKESGRIVVTQGSDGRFWFSAETDTEGSYAAFDIAEAQVRGLLAFIDAIRADQESEVHRG